MTIESMIPTFEPGERVRVHYREYEWFCPVCGEPKRYIQELPDSEIVTINPSPPYMTHGGGLHKSPWPDGFYKIMDDDGETIAVPYTLLEKME